MVMEPTVRYVQRADLDMPPTVVVECCREWVVAVTGHPGGSWGRCGLCGERPTYKREDTESPHLTTPTD